MRYENSLTTNVQSFIENTLARKIAGTENGMNISGTARDVRAFLSDPTTVNTPDFVIRRYVQARYPELLPKNVQIPDLSQNKNIPWDADVIEYLAASLAKLAKEKGINIVKKEWRNYLSGHGASREKIFMIAFTLNMGVEDTMDLLLACDQESYSVRYPLDLVCLFCQDTPGKYSWAEAEGMVEQFLTRRTVSETEVPQPAPGMTRQIATRLRDIFAQNLPDADAKAELVTYMARNASEFVSYRKTVKVAPKGPDGKPLKDAKKEEQQKEIFLPGYSLTRMKLFMRLAQYLAVLYPTHDVPDPDNLERNEVKRLELDADGMPPLPFLARSTFCSSEWKEILWPDPKKEQASPSPFEESMRLLCANYEQHLMAVQRLRSGGKNVAFFERRDALLFTYFLISGYSRLCSSSLPEDREKFDIIDDMVNSGDDFDYAVAEVLDKVDYVYEMSGDEDAVAEQFSTLVQCFNLILSQLDYMNLYLPAPFDRFVALSLLSATPEELTPLIMCRSELEYYESLA